MSISIKVSTKARRPIFPVKFGNGGVVDHGLSEFEAQACIDNVIGPAILVFDFDPVVVTTADFVAECADIFWITRPGLTAVVVVLAVNGELGSLGGFHVTPKPKHPEKHRQPGSSPETKTERTVSPAALRVPS